jgi:hypothetical protein
VPLALIVAFTVTTVTAMYYAVKALTRLAPDRNALWKVFIQGPLARRDLFTPDGWRYWKLSFAYLFVGICMLLLWALTRL